MNEPSIHQVQEALERILASPGFQSSERMSAFLRFVVQHKLNGDAAPLKEFLIAERVFGRDESFDPRADTIVRVEARRLRSKLEKYYLSEGLDDPIVIQLAARGYTPVFRALDSVETVAPRAMPSRRIVFATTALATLVFAVGAAAWLSTRRSDAPQFTHSVAVIPCASVSSNPDDEALATGLSTDVVSLLRNVQDLRVVSHSPPSQANAGVADARAIGKTLSVDAVLECTLLTEVTRHLVTARLVSVNDGLPIWTDQFEREFDGARSAPEIARSIIAGLEIAMTPSVEARIRPLTVNGEAARNYSIGRHHLSRAAGTMQYEHLQQAVSFMELSTEADPNYAAAYAGLSDALGFLAGSGIDPHADETVARASRAARKAYELDPNLAESQVAMGALHATEGNWSACDRYFLRAIALKPSLTSAYQAYAVLCLGSQRRHDEAIARLRQAIAIEPAGAETYVFLGQSLVYAGRTDEALAELNMALQLEPEYVTARVTAALAYIGAGNYREARRRLQEVESTSGALPYYQGLLGYTLARLGEHHGATKALERLMALRSGPVEIDIAGIYSGLDDVDAALTWLEKGHSRLKAATAFVADDPRFRALHSNPRFVSLLKQMGLPIE